jgi:peptidoglycan hydrolase-like protein with peptidoglycan-binding domain
VSRVARALGVLTIPVVVIPASLGGHAQAAAVPKPPSKSLPSALDVASPYQAQRLCDPTAKPGVVSFAALLSTHYKLGGAAGIIRNCNSGVTEHSEGRAWDWMLNASRPHEKAVADAVTAWLSAPDAQGRPGAMARRFGIMYIIWNKKMWRAYDPGRGWAAYTGSSPHTDHVHFSFSWDGAYGRTSWWTGKALTTISPGPAVPKPAPTPTGPPTAPVAVYKVLVRGATGADVALAQKAIGVTADGVFGPRTEAALKAWQTRSGVKATGVLDLSTWSAMVARKLVPSRGNTPAPAATPAPHPLAAHARTTIRKGAKGPAVSALQKALGLKVDGLFGTSTENAVRAFQTRRNLPANGVVGPSTWTALMNPVAPPTPARPTPSAVTTPYTAVKSTVLRVGSTGNAVKALQRALGGLSVDGAYGARTAAAVKAFQKARKLAQNGVTDAKVWQALEDRDYPLRAHYGTVLKVGSRGNAVVALQKSLRIPADGAYGPQTQAAVKALQGRAKLARTGVVATLTWKALEAELRKR